MNTHPMDLIDIGVNLAHDSFDADRDAILRRAHAAGVVQMVVTGSSEDNTRKAIAMSQEHRGVLFATAGVHPHHAADVTPETLPALQELARDAHVVAVGECGLDYFRDLSPRDLQRRAFGWQLELAAATGKPVFLHQRDAHEDFIAILREHRVTRGVAHCFTAGEKERDAYLALGLHIGITGWINDERRGLPLREVVKGIPAERLMLESDAPYLLPRDIRPRLSTRRNEPGYLPWVLRAVAAARNEDAAQTARITTLNARRLFALPG
ncbi:MAG TPA: TatD family hydrolase [Steroidobacteraceae bacterium]|nr:TatD family hydrolase [Steroidobacteraceae bacterium]